MICPIRSAADSAVMLCLIKECAWYDGISKQCGLMTLAFSVVDLDISMRRFFGFDENAKAENEED